MNARRLTIISSLCATLALAVPWAANAHLTDALHQHGFSSTYSLFNPTFKGTPERCGSATAWFDGSVQPGTVEAFLPDLVTSPTLRSGESRRVFVTAKLERYDFSAKRTLEVSDWSPWAYTFANGSGRTYNAWFDWNSSTPSYLGRVIGTNRLAWSASPGWYRVHLHFYWEYDAYRHDEYTGWCEVSVFQF
jgi:hypothetical protein